MYRAVLACLTALSCAGAEPPAAEKPPPAPVAQPVEVAAPPVLQGVTTTTGVPDASEADGTGKADRFTGCEGYELTYEYAKQGETEAHPPFRVKPGDVVREGGAPLEPDIRAKLSFQPAPDEAVVIRNDNLRLVQKSCAVN